MGMLDKISEILAIILAVQWIAMAIVNLTPTPEDNKWVGKFYRLIEVIAGVISKTAKEYPGERRIIERELADSVQSVSGETSNEQPRGTRRSDVDASLHQWSGND